MGFHFRIHVHLLCTILYTKLYNLYVIVSPEVVHTVDPSLVAVHTVDPSLVAVHMVDPSWAAVHTVDPSWAVDPSWVVPWVGAGPGRWRS